MKQPRPPLMGLPLLFIVACAELIAGDGRGGVHDCRLKAEKADKMESAEKRDRSQTREKPEKIEHGRAPASGPDARKPTAAPAAGGRIRCDDDEAPPELWDGTGRSEAVRGA